MATKNKSQNTSKNNYYGLGQVEIYRSGENKIGLNLSSIKSPDRRFCADGFNISYSFGQYHLNFFQRCVCGSKLRALLQIRLNNIPFSDFLESIKSGDRNNMEFPDFDDDSEFHLDKIFEEPKQTIAFEASVANILISDSISYINFYVIPRPSEMMDESRKSISIEEVASISFPLEMAKSFVAAVKKFQK